jgi:hypothetical protein
MKLDPGLAQCGSHPYGGAGRSVSYDPPRAVALPAAVQGPHNRGDGPEDWREVLDKHFAPSPGIVRFGSCRDAPCHPGSLLQTGHGRSATSPEKGVGGASLTFPGGTTPVKVTGTVSALSTSRQVRGRLMT